MVLCHVIFCWVILCQNQLKNYSFQLSNYHHHHHHHHHHQVVPPARISLTLSRHFSLSFIAFGRSSGLHPVSSHNGCMYVRAGRPAFAWPYTGVHRSTSLMSSSLLLQQTHLKKSLVSFFDLIFSIIYWLL